MHVDQPDAFALLLFIPCEAVAPPEDTAFAILLSANMKITLFGLC